MKERTKDFLGDDFFNYSGFKLESLPNGTDGYRAAVDAMNFADRRQSIFWSTIGSLNFDGGLSYQIGYRGLSDEIEESLSGKSDEYLKIFKPMNEWLSRGILDDYIATGGQRFRFVCGTLSVDCEQVENDIPDIR